MQRRAITILSMDGIRTEFTGVGTITGNFIEAYFDIITRVFGRDTLCPLYCIAPSPASNAETQMYSARADAVCLRSGGQLLDLPVSITGRDRHEFWAGNNEVEGYTLWTEYTTNGAAILERLAADYDELYVFLADSCFAKVPTIVKTNKHLYFIWLPHSNGHLFKDRWAPLRERWECEALCEYRVGRDFIGYMSDHVRDLLKEKYHLDDRLFVAFKDGILPTRRNYSVSDDDTLRIKQLLPSEKNIIFSWGRCVAQKGFDLLLPQLRTFLQEQPSYSVVLLMPTDTSEQSYVDAMLEQVRTLPNGQALVFWQFDGKMPFVMLKRIPLAAVILPSRYESSGMAALESLEFLPSETPILHSNIPSYSEIFRDQPRCFRIDNADAHGYLSVLRGIVNSRSGASLRRLNPFRFVDGYVSGINCIRGSL